ncbi:MAG: nuclear transport factor 2 family protein [Elusimicrobia bacterium]|nr:nuclear transport factor 2 family protein [Elusimicrobiota bacterium]
MLTIALSLLLGLPAAARTPDAAVAAVLDDWHAAAAKPDEERYFAHFAPDAVFIGTDAWERWDLEAFREYAHKRFVTGKGWTLVPSDRHVSFSPDGKTAWFDEAVTSQSYGLSRGSGVLVRSGDRWLIAQYNLSVPIPNDLLLNFAGIIKAWKEKGAPPRP